jgi:hypothetical protein
VVDWIDRLSIFLAVVVFFLAVMIFEIRRHLNLDDWTPSRKWKKRFAGSRRQPNCQPDEVPSLADERDTLFFQRTSKMADWLNSLYSETPWSFENTGRLEASLGSENGAERLIQVWYNQQRTGRIYMSTFHRPRKGPTINVKLDLANSRMFDGSDVAQLGMSLAYLVCDTREEVQNAHDQIQSSMINAMWQVNREFGNPELVFSFNGQLTDLLAHYEKQ